MLATELAKSAMAKAEDVITKACGDPKVEYLFTDLVEIIKREAGVDESTAKATILRLNSEGLIELTPDWRVRKAKQAA
jgi:hypothetical protein